MKHFSQILILAGALSLPTMAMAQPYNKAHQITVSEVKGFTWPTFARGERMQDNDVMALQYLLRNRGFYKANVDGEFGELTEKAVRDFQRAKGLKVDGIVGPQTWTPLVLRLKKGDRGNSVRAFQIALRGFVGHSGQRPFRYQEVDGIFGSSTRANVIKYQKGWAANANLSMKDNLTADGIVGPRTWAALLGAEFDG